MSAINRGPLGSAFLIGRDPSGATYASGAAQAADPQSPKDAKPAPSKPSGPIPMPGPVLSAGPTTPTPSHVSAILEADLASDDLEAGLRPADGAGSIATASQMPAPPPKGSLITTDLARSLAEVKGQAQFLLYLADQIEDSLHQLVEEHDDCQNSFLCRVLSMYSNQLETKHHGLGDKISETCQEIYITVREYDPS